MEDNKSNINKDDLPKSNSPESLVNLEVIKNMLTEVGLLQYDLEVVTHLADCADFYTTSIIEKATALMKHANRTTIDKTDITLAIEFIDNKYPKRLSQKELIELARKHNKTELPNIESRGLALPNTGVVLKETNCKMKSPYSNITKYQMNYPLMDLMNRQNQMIAMQHHQGGLTTVLRSPLGNCPVPVNLTPQRIVIKPKLPTGNNPMMFSQNKMDERVLKFYEMPKK